MASTIQERLKAVRLTLKLSQRDFCKGVFLEQSTYARIEQGKTKVNDRFIELLSTKYHVSKVYLKEGAGDMFTDKGPPDVRLEQLNQIFNALNPILQDYLIAQAKELLKVLERGEK